MRRTGGGLRAATGKGAVPRSYPVCCDWCNRFVCWLVCGGSDAWSVALLLSGRAVGPARGCRGSQFLPSPCMHFPYFSADADRSLPRRPPRGPAEPPRARRRAIRRLNSIHHAVLLVASYYQSEMSGHQSAKVGWQRDRLAAAMIACTELQRGRGTRGSQRTGARSHADDRPGDRAGRVYRLSGFGYYASGLSCSSS